MATFYLINTTQYGSDKYFAGDLLDDSVDPTSGIAAAGGVLWASADALVAAMATLVRSKRTSRAINEAAADQLMMAAAAAQAKATPAGTTFQAGTGTLASGTVTINATLTANSRILVTMKDPGAGAITGFAGFDTPVASRNVGAGTFVVNAIDDSKATLATAVCTFDWLVVG